MDADITKTLPRDEIIPRRNNLPIHPLLLALYPILFLYSQNIDQMAATVVIGPILATLAVAGIAWLLLRRLFRSPEKAAIAISFLLCWFFSYGHVFNLGGDSSSHRVLLPIWGVLLVLVMGGLWRARRDLTPLTRLLNLIAITLMAMLVIGIGSYEAAAQRSLLKAPAMRMSFSSEGTLQASSPRPDIYYLILDSYANAQTLKSMYDYEDTPFLQALERRGFVVARRSHSNYPFTLTSMASSLNMRYDDPLARRFGTDARDLAPLMESIQDNNVMRFLQEQGYATLVLNSPTKLWQLGFANLLRRTTLLCCLHRNSDAIVRDRTLALFDRVAHLPPCPQPRFVYAHILCPHEPFVFGPNGESVASAPAGGNGERVGITKRLYIGQLTYTNTLALHLIDTLLAHSRKPPIIILQADHGPRILTPALSPTSTCVNERLRILNAYYLPIGGKRIVYDAITPVNTFRLLFNYYFGAHFAKLPDRSYYCTYDTPYRYENVTGSLH